MHKVIGFVVGLSLIVPAVALASSPVNTFDNVGAGMIFCSGPMAPGWTNGVAGGGCGNENYVPFNGSTCMFSQGCILPKQ